jgi:Sulfotransferase domain
MSRVIKGDSGTGNIPSLAARIGRRAHRDVLRTTRTPFDSRFHRPLLVHCSHHKAGTVWFLRVLMAVATSYGLRSRVGAPEPIGGQVDLVYFANAGDFDRDLLGSRPIRGSHVIRDPRDLVVSGYEYHLVTKEAWAQVPRPFYGGRGYQDYLRSLNEYDGLMAEILWFAATTALGMEAWDYGQPDMLELRYEDVLADERGSFERLFRWYGFNDAALACGLEAVGRLSLRNSATTLAHPVRASVPGEWRDRLSPEHVARFKERTGDLVVRLGYETDADW